MDPSEDWSGSCQPSDAEMPENQVQEDNQIIPGFDNFDDYVQRVFDAVRAGIKASNNLPIGSNHNYYSCFPSFLAAKDANINMLLNIMQNALGTAGIKNKIKNRDIEEKFDLLLETNDVLLDRANALMDEESGIAKGSEVELIVTHTKKQAINGSWNKQSPQPAEASRATQSVRLLAGRNVHRPQLSFKDKIDNGSKPWCPRIKDKPNSSKPLAIYLEEGENGETFNHPYEYELDMFVLPDEQLKRSAPAKYKSLEETPLVMIESPSDLKSLLEDLKNYKEIAVDLEHHSYRSFQGITCLMQISTGDTDYLIDTLSLRSELHELNEIFAKRTVLKVFHGADLDIQWLQRDLSLYVVNMFDTHQAAKQLNLPYLSLAYLLKQYCSIDPNKHFQLADWRIRPLPEELQKYAREDTHYLLHIKDVLRNALIDAANGQTNVLKAVYDRSTEICRKTYVKPVWTEESCMSIYRKSQKMFNNKQLYALRELHKWRDATARQEDDSTSYVLPNHMLLNIAETLPREMQGILACCNPIPPLVRQNILKLHKIVLKAREQPLIKPVLEDIRQRLTQRNNITNSEAWMYSPHDIPSGTEARADLPCLLDKAGALETPISNTIVNHIVTVFDSPATSEIRSYSARNEYGREFFKLLSEEKYPKLVDLGLKISSMFGSTYRCESAFSVMKNIKSKYRSRLADHSLSSLLRIAVTKIDVDIPSLVNNMTQPQCARSHSQRRVKDDDVAGNEQKSVRKKKFVFVSPFERYKRVIPMVAEEEAQERERQRQEEDRLNKLKKDEEKEEEGEDEIAKSKSRVFEHFKQVAEVAGGGVVVTPKKRKKASSESPPKKPSQVPLGQMQGRKRKRDSNISKQNDARERHHESFLTPVPLLDIKTSQGVKNESDEPECVIYEQKTQDARIQEPASDNDLKSMRSRKRGERKRAINELSKKGLMPSEAFDYKAVDFSSFQGGSKRTSNQVNFEQTMEKRKEKKRKKKKQKLNI